MRPAPRCVVIVFTAWALLASGWLRAASVGGLGSAASPGSAASGCPTCADLYLIRRGWHIDVGFATTDLEPPLRLLGRDFPGARFLMFGFGDRRYLLAKRRGGGTLLAALWPGSALILATGLIAAPDAAFASDQVMTIRMSRQALRSAQVFVWQSLTKSAASPDGPVTRYASGPYEGSLYFGATATYSAVHTCNTWVAEVLASAGLPIRPEGVLFAGQLWRRARRLAHPTPSAAALQQGGFEPF